MLADELRQLQAEDVTPGRGGVAFAGDRVLLYQANLWLRTAVRVLLPILDFDFAQLLLLPGEAYVEYQLLAQRLEPDSFVVALGYGECATGYVPTEQAVKENDGNLRDWCWVAPGAEKALTAALREGLRP